MSADFNQLDNFFMDSNKNGERKPRFSRFQKIRDFFPTREQFYYLPRMLSSKERYGIIALTVIVLLSLFSLPISAHYHGTEEGADYGGSWSEAMIGTPQHINPILLQANDVDSDLANLMYAGLMRYDGQGKLVPDLAESYSISEDGLEYTFKLRPNLRWHDGQALTADDILYTIITVQNADYNSPQRINWQGVDVSKTDDQTISLRLKNRYAQFLNNTTLGILPKHVWENIKASNFVLSENNLKPVGSGPYKLSKTRRDATGNIVSLEVAAFDKYALGRPYIDNITFNFYENEQTAITAYNRGDVDGLSFVSAEKLDSLRLKNNLTIHEIRLPRYFSVFYNQSRSKQLSDKEVRRALEYATDRQAIIDSILKGKGSIVTSPLLPGIIDIPGTAASPSFDLEKAKKTLDDAGWKLSEGQNTRSKTIKAKEKGAADETLKLEVEITTSSWPEIAAVANMLKAQWEKAGVAVSVRTLSVPEVQQAIKERDFIALLFGEVLGLDPDPFSFWHSSQKKDPGLNLSLYDDKDADKILEDARQIMDNDKRKESYAKLQRIIVDDVPALFLYSPDYLYVQPEKIKHNKVTIMAVPSNRFDTVNEWYIDTKRIKR